MMGRKRNFVAKIGADLAKLRYNRRKDDKNFAAEPTLTVLMFHHCLEKEPAEPWKKALTISPKTLEKIIELGHEYYTFVTLSEAKTVLTRKKKLKNPHMLALTFDDGYQDFYDNAFPVIKKQKVPANVNIVGSFAESEDPEFMHWETLKKLNDSEYIELDSHSFDMHKEQDGKAVIFSMCKKALAADADKNDELFEKHLGYRPKNLILPYGMTVLGLAEALGGRYDFIVTTSSGVNTKRTNPYMLHRFAVLESESPEQLYAILNGYLGLEYVKYGII